LIYGLVSYGGLVLINNSELDLPNMWIAYLPMFIGVYVVTQWLDSLSCDGDLIPSVISTP
jgi:hypothetical protein